MNNNHNPYFFDPKNPNGFNKIDEKPKLELNEERFPTYVNTIVGAFIRKNGGYPTELFLGDENIEILKKMVKNNGFLNKGDEITIEDGKSKFANLTIRFLQEKGGIYVGIVNG